jgi:hypothetical protein
MFLPTSDSPRRGDVHDGIDGRRAVHDSKRAGRSAIAAAAVVMLIVGGLARRASAT